MARRTVSTSAVVSWTVLAGLLTTSCGLVESDVQGSVFIVTRGGESVKLGLVEVMAIPERDIVPFIAGKGLTAEKEQAAIKPLIEQADLDAREARAAERKAESEYWAALRRCTDQAVSARLLRLFDDASHRHKAASTAANGKADAAAQLRARYRHWTSGAYYFEDMVPGVAVAKTDADGEFSLRLRRGARYALAARANRAVMDSTEQYYWLVWVVPEGRGTRVLLSNDNLLTSGAQSSVVSVTE